MAELNAISPCSGLPALSIGAVKLVETDAGRLTSLSPFADGAGLSDALQAAHGVSMPAPNTTTSSGDTRCIWFGRNEALLIGPEPDKSLFECGAVVDQSDAWAVTTLTGAGAQDVLARLVPVDLRQIAFAVGATRRTQLGHMNASITRTGPDAFLIMVFRSMATTLVHDLKQAMEAVAARR